MFPSKSSSDERALFSVRSLLLLVLSVLMVSLTTLWWLGIGLEDGKAATAGFLSATVTIFLAEFLRRRLRMSLKAFLLVFTLLAVILGLLGEQFIQSRKQRLAVAEVLAVGGRASYDYEDRGGPWFRTRAGLLLPVWLRRLLGNDFLGRVERISVGSPDYGDSQMRIVASGCPEMQELIISNTSVTAHGLRSVEGLLKLSCVWLNGNQATQRGIQCLSGCPQLEELHLSGPQITDETVAHLGQLEHLRRLGLHGTNVSNAGLGQLSSLKSLETLDISECGNVDDAGMSEVAQLTRLRILFVSNTALTDSSARYLREMSSLRRLGLFGTSLTQQGLEQLATEMPNCKVNGW